MTCPSAMVPTDKGTYALILRLARARRIRVGRLGLIDFPAGTYVYIGSAFGPGGLRARIAHHMKRSAHPRWHVDYLRCVCRVEGNWHLVGERAECQWAHRLSRCEGVTSVTGFGCSDCKCPSHLFRVVDTRLEDVGRSVFGERPGADERIARVPMPDTDPVLGHEGGLRDAHGRWRPDDRGEWPPAGVQVSQRLGWVTYEDCNAVHPGACPWLERE